ncbi:hypothetical protein Tco_1501285 [Tanacetum coccineum]
MKHVMIGNMLTGSQFVAFLANYFSMISSILAVFGQIVEVHNRQTTHNLERAYSAKFLSFAKFISSRYLDGFIGHFVDNLIVPAVNFTQKHEIRQVYIRSTARVYEIYYAPALQSDDEYLCTVHCSATSVEDNFFSETDVKEVISVNPGDSNDILPKTRVASENKVGTNEDDWVEVKCPADRVDDGNAYLPSQQDYYEATAEINDSEPCMSLTLRLLSLKSKGCFYVDEVYVFADPIDMDDSEDQTANTTSSSNSSLMTMLFPAFLGLNKSRSAQLHDQYNSNPARQSIEAESCPTTSTNRVNLVDQQDGKVPNQSEAKVPSLTLDKDKVCDSTQNNAFSYHRPDSLPEQLVSRMSRIEDICLRFEEKMLKPINSIEARLERVEQQIELLSKNSQSPRFESNIVSTSNSENNSQLCGELESENTGSFSNGTHKPPEDTSVAEYTQVHEDMLTDKKEEANDVFELPKEEKPKKTVSVDDALAAALAGLSSFTKTNDIISDVPLESPEEECLKTKQTSIYTTLGSNSSGDASVSCEFLKANAPGFTGEDTVGGDSAISSTPESSLVERGDSTTTSRKAYTEIPDHIFCSSEASEVVEKAAMGSTTSFCYFSPHESDQMDPELIKQDSKVVKISNFDKADILKIFPDQCPDASCSPNSGEINDESESKVDFESQILEVKFASLGNGSVDSHLEALLSYTNDPATNKEAFVAPETNEKTTVINNLLVDLDGDDVGEGVEQDLPPVEQETSFASLI